jgi:hypothetical protein
VPLFPFFVSLRKKDVLHRLFLVGLGIPSRVPEQEADGACGTSFHSTAVGRQEVECGLAKLQKGTIRQGHRSQQYITAQVAASWAKTQVNLQKA